MITYIYINEDEEQTYHIDHNLIQKDSLLDIIYRNREDKINNIAYSSDHNLPGVIYYLNNPYQTNDIDIISTLEYWGVYRSYNTIFADENYMMTNMYGSEFINHPMNTDMYYNLQRMDTFAGDYLQFIEDYTKPDNLMFYRPPFKQVMSYEEMLRDFEPINFLFELAKDYNMTIMVTGEYVVDRLIGMLNKDNTPNTDVFFIGDVTNIAAYINAVVETLESVYEHELSVRLSSLIYSRSKHLISLSNNAHVTSKIPKIHFILASYRTYSEVLHSSDIDCCCVGWDGTDVWATERGKYALFRGYNTVNLDLASEYYERRLAKYGKKGISVYLPEGDKYNIKRKNIANYDDTFYPRLGVYSELKSSAITIEWLRMSGIVDVDRELVDKIFNMMDQVNPDEADEEHEIEYAARDLTHLSRINLLVYYEYIYQKGQRFDQGNNPSDYQFELKDLKQLVPTMRYSTLVIQEYRLQRNNEVVDKLQQIIGDNLPDRRDPHNEYSISINVDTDIIVIANKQEGLGVVAGLNISDNVYEAMQVFGNIQLSKDTGLVVKHEGERARTILAKMMYETHEDWYVGTYSTPNE